eukprot:7948625-Karenia_brevis.AAC.1
MTCNGDDMPSATLGLEARSCNGIKGSFIAHYVGHGPRAGDSPNCLLTHARGESPWEPGLSGLLPKMSHLL